MDLSILLLTTLPLRVLAVWVASVMSLSCLFIQYCFHSSDIALHLAEKVRLIQLTCALSHAQVKLLLQVVDPPFVQLLDWLFTQLCCFHHITVLLTKVVCTGSLAAARVKASRAISSATPSIS